LIVLLHLIDRNSFKSVRIFFFCLL
jgi:hypothetical protein